MRIRFGVLAAFFLLAAACGDDNGAATTTTATTAATTVTTPTTASTATTGPVDDGPFAEFLSAPVEDPFFGSGFHAMAYGDENHTFVVSLDSLMGADPAIDRLAVGFLDPSPAASGIGVDQMLMAVWVDNWSGDIAPTGVSLYTLGADGWDAYVTIDAASILGFLETTSDYDARRPDGPPVLQLALTSFDWTGAAHFTADTSVFDLIAGGAATFTGEVECTLADILECLLLSDDGVLRLGDSGDAVEDLQDSLIDIGYLGGPSSGVYDEDTEDAVRAFQTDYRLARDGRAGPQTLGLIEDIGSGTSTIVMASQFGVGPVLFGTASLPAWLALQEILGAPDSEIGWYTDGCDGHEWWKSTWDGFTAIFTDRDVPGSPEFDGWHVDDLSDLPEWLYFVGGIRPGSTWGYVSGLGGHYDPGYGGFFTMTDLGYNNGRFVVTPPYPSDPATSAVVQSFGTGTGGFVSC